MKLKREKVKIIAFVSGMLILMVGIWFILYHFEGASEKTPMSNNKQLFQDPEKKQPDEIVSYLIIGTDASGSTGNQKEYQGNMADFLLLFVMNKTQKTYGFLQLNRDSITDVTMLQKDGTGYASADMQVCTAHWFGKDEEASCKNTVKAVSKLLGGIKIDGYYSLQMESIPEINHLVGGINVTLEEDFTKMDPSMKKGATVTLNDEQAYHYLHDRYGVGDESNLSRMSRQKQYMQAMLDKVKEKSNEDASFINKMYKELQQKATTDLKGRDISSLMNAQKGSSNIGLFTLEGKSKKGEALGDGLEHMEFYPSKQSIKDIQKKLNFQSKGE